MALFLVIPLFIMALIVALILGIGLKNRLYRITGSKV